MADPYINFITTNHSLYDRYSSDWLVCYNSWLGGTEYKRAKYLRAYAADLATPSETINTYDLASDGSIVAKYKSQIAKTSYSNSENAVRYGQDVSTTGNFYGEKLDNTALYNFVKLIVAEYNAILFRNPPQRTLPETPEVEEFLSDVSGEGESINEFMSLVDMYTTIFGVCHVSCIKPVGSDIPKWRIHTPLDVTNWEYFFDVDGNLKLRRLVVRVDDSDLHTVYRYFTDATVETVFVGKGENRKDYAPPVDSPALEQLDDGIFRIVQINELGYIPVKTFYQSTKVYNNIGTTVIQDIAQIQRSIYSHNAEIYSAIAYGSHPTLVVDENTHQLNDGQVGAEPGALVKVQASLTGTPTHVYEFKAPPLDAISEIRDLIDNMVQKLSQIAMLRSEDLIRAANSGAQIEIFDDKLSAMIRRKATNLENGEAKLWDIWFDWLNMIKPEDFSISYNRQYNRRALEIELKEVDLMMQTLQKYEELTGESEDESEEEEYANEGMEAEEEYATGAACPVATQDVSVNLKNRQSAIDGAAYGPLNPSQPNDEFWERLADKWSVTVDQAKQSRCGNCAAFIQTSKMLQCIDTGLAAGGATGSEWDTVAAGDLGYCEAFDFKCASNRTCDAWITGGPITDSNAPMSGAIEAAETETENGSANREEQLINQQFKQEMRDKIRQRLEQLFKASTTDNGF